MKVFSQRLEPTEKQLKVSGPIETRHLDGRVDSTRRLIFLECAIRRRRPTLTTFLALMFLLVGVIVTSFGPHATDCRDSTPTRGVRAPNTLPILIWPHATDRGCPTLTRGVGTPNTPLDTDQASRH